VLEVLGDPGRIVHVGRRSTGDTARIMSGLTGVPGASGSRACVLSCCHSCRLGDLYAQVGQCPFQQAGDVHLGDAEAVADLPRSGPPPTRWYTAMTIPAGRARSGTRLYGRSTPGPQAHQLGLSAWELACHAFPAAIFAGQGVFVVPVDDELMLETGPCGQLHARPMFFNRKERL
jgi:hypothetical protein